MNDGFEFWYGAVPIIQMDDTGDISTWYGGVPEIQLFGVTSNEIIFLQTGQVI